MYEYKIIDNSPENESIKGGQGHLATIESNFTS